MMIRPGVSLWLDVVRVLAALAVILGHFAHIRFTRGDYYFLREINIASDAVIVFFVISGVVIAYAAERDKTLPRYAFNRLTRLWTVIIPAIFLTILFDAIGTSIRMEAYQAPYFYDVSLGEFLFRGLTFTQHWTGVLDPIRLGTNGPLWSLSYEAAYYALFGIFVFTSGARRIVLLVLVAYLADFRILLLMPCWLMGVWAWRMIRSGAIHEMSRLTALVLAVAAPMVLVLFKVGHVDQLLAELTQQMLAPANYKLFLLYSDEVLWNTIIAFCTAVHLLGMARLLAAREVDEARAWPRAIRWVAGGSFSLYVVHYPTLHLLDATLPESLPGYDLIFLTTLLAVCFAFAAVFERPLKAYRGAIERVWHGVTSGSDARKAEAELRAGG